MNQHKRIAYFSLGTDHIVCVCIYFQISCISRTYVTRNYPIKHMADQVISDWSVWNFRRDMEFLFSPMVGPDHEQHNHIFTFAKRCNNLLPQLLISVPLNKRFAVHQIFWGNMTCVTLWYVKASLSTLLRLIEHCYQTTHSGCGWIRQLSVMSIVHCYDVKFLRISVLLYPALQCNIASYRVNLKIVSRVWNLKWDITSVSLYLSHRIPKYTV